MPDFKGHDNFYIKKGEQNIDFSFEHTDDFLPTGRDIQSTTVYATDRYGESVSSLIETYSVDDNIVVVRMSYPTEGEGTYHLRFVNDLGDDKIKTSRFNRMVATKT